MKSLKIAGLLLTLSIAGGCGRIASPGDLLHAPNLANEEQSLYNAVQPFLPAGYQLTTPDQSDQGGAIRAADLDGDGEKELIVSYKKPDTDYQVNVLILNKQNGAWHKADQITGSGTNLDYLAIKPLTDTSSSELLLGYGGGGYGLPKELYVYSFSGQKAEQIFHRSYDQIAVGDLIGGGLSQIALVPPVTDNDDTRSQIQLIGAEKSKLSELAVRRTDGSVLNMQIRQAASDRSGLFAQVLGTTRSGYAMLLAWSDGRLANILSLPQSAYDSRSSRGELKLGAPDYSSDLASTEQKWWIDYPADNRDVDGDGIMEVALPNPMPGTENSSGAPQLWSDSYYRWDGARGMKFVEDRFWQWGYDLRIPDRWLGNYKVELSAEDEDAASEIRFVYSGEDGGQADANGGNEDAKSEAGKAPVLLTLRQMPAEQWNRLQAELQSAGSDYVVLSGSGKVVPGQSSQVTAALLPGQGGGLSGEQAERYDKLRPTRAEVRAMADMSSDEEEAESDVEGH
ncbi:hypothetical protein QWJ34_24865 [Saccharibacillus sp. CPCC 101409]|uniref:hypothetical protein n=1 Tax=Saccharibacillus sp. CPCC 101409 TaxID=3058041 RepID=UPI0026720233|nr:hypothetical protein [Saccharibacillus sp. CPCC 101409]MDO3413019.1 hypothetical protein [Saccharibacillus sp. CPCC 101409]